MPLGTYLFSVLLFLFIAKIRFFYALHCMNPGILLNSAAVAD